MKKIDWTQARHDTGIARKLVFAIATELGSAWSVKTQETHFIHATDPHDGRGFQIYFPNNRAKNVRLEVVPHWPRFKTGMRSHPSMLAPPRKVPSVSLSVSRGPIAIAHEIERRFLPAYTCLYDALSKYVASNDRWQEGKDTTFAAICKTLGMEPSEHETAVCTFSLYEPYYVEVSVVGPDMISIKASSLSQELATELLLRLHPQARKETK